MTPIRTSSMAALSFPACRSSSEPLAAAASGPERRDAVGRYTVTPGERSPPSPAHRVTMSEIVRLNPDSTAPAARRATVRLPGGIVPPAAVAAADVDITPRRGGAGTLVSVPGSGFGRADAPAAFWSALRRIGFRFLPGSQDGRSRHCGRHRAHPRLGRRRSWCSLSRRSTGGCAPSRPARDRPHRHAPAGAHASPAR